MMYRRATHSPMAISGEAYQVLENPDDITQ